MVFFNEFDFEVYGRNLVLVVDDGMKLTVTGPGKSEVSVTGYIESEEDDLVEEPKKEVAQAESSPAEEEEEEIYQQRKRQSEQAEESHHHHQEGIEGKDFPLDDSHS